MNYWEAILYGAVQGFTEYLPISSSAHLILLPRFLKIEEPGLAFDVFLHLGTLFSTLVYFRSDWIHVFRSFLNSLWRRSEKQPDAGTLSWKLIFFGTLPAVIVALVFYSWIKTNLRDNEILVFSLSVGGILLFLADRYFSRQKGLETLSVKAALFVGACQSLALIPGVSRSGATIMAGRFLGLDRASSAKFSFMLSAPIVFAAVVFEARHWGKLVESTMGYGPLIVAGISAFLSGFLAIAGLLRLLRKFGYLGFALYRCALAIVIWKTFL